MRLHLSYRTQKARKRTYTKDIRRPTDFFSFSSSSFVCSLSQHIFALEQLSHFIYRRFLFVVDFLRFLFSQCFDNFSDRRQTSDGIKNDRFLLLFFFSLSCLLVRNNNCCGVRFSIFASLWRRKPKRLINVQTRSDALQPTKFNEEIECRCSTSGIPVNLMRKKGEGEIHFC